VPGAPSEALAARIRRLLTGLGLHEARTLTMGPADHPDAPTIVNPLASDEAHLRTALLPGLRRALEYNWSVQQRDVRLFEIGHVFRRVPDAPEPGETMRVAAVLTGARYPAHWSESGRAPDLDLWDVKGMFEEVVRAVGIAAVIEPLGEGWMARDAGGNRTGWAGPLTADAPPWAARVFGLEADLRAAAEAAVRFAPLPSMPSADRDLALVLPEGRTAAEVETVMRHAAGALLEAVTVFDEYRGEGLAGRSVAWRLVFRDPTRTLRDVEVDQAVERILSALRSELGIERRQT
jgi:phenylalanyl-tRNA synthetase beta chain